MIDFASQANHGFIPRDGGMASPGYTQAIISTGLMQALNFEKVRQTSVDLSAR